MFYWKIIPVWLITLLKEISPWYVLKELLTKRYIYHRSGTVITVPSSMRLTKASYWSQPCVLLLGDRQEVEEARIHSSRGIGKAIVL